MERMPPTKIFQGKKYFIVEDLVKILSLTPLSVRTYLSSGKIKSIKVGMRYYVAEKDLIDFLDGGRFTKPDEFASQVNEAIRRTFEANVEWLAHRVKELIITDLTKNITEKLIKVDQINVRSTEFGSKEKTAERIRKTEVIKKDFEKVK
ncbi:hypothetical protein ES703_65434 [subsurface metagenome]